MTTAATMPETLDDFSCTNCRKRFTPDSELARAGMLVCPRCSAVYPVRAQMGPGEGGRRQGKGLGELAPPAGFEIEKADENEMIITCRWTRADLNWAIPIFAALLFLLGVVTFFSVPRIDEWTIQVTLAAVWLGALPLAIMTGLSTYRVIAAKINRSTIRVTKDHISVRRGPMPGGHHCELDVAGLQQIFCSQKSRMVPGTPPHYTYDVYCAVADPQRGPRRVRLMRRLPRPEHAIFLEQRIEDYLKIEDRRVGSEILA